MEKIGNLLAEGYWQKRLERLKRKLERNNFEVFLAADQAEAKDVVMNEIIPDTGAQLISMGDSLTAIDTGLFDAIRNQPDLEFLDTFESGIPFGEAAARRRQALQVDLFITGTNAVTRRGQLVNLDMVGNRVGAIAYGPRYVVIMMGRNKLARDLETAMERVKN